MYVFFTMVPLCLLCGQEVKPPEQTPGLQKFFQLLVEHYNPVALPKYEDVLKVTDQIGAARPENISRALPSIELALAHQDDNVKADAVLALFAIGLRPDSAALLKDYLKPIANLLNSPSARLQLSVTQVLGMLKPEPPPEVSPALLSFLKQTDRDPLAQAGAISALVRIAPGKQGVDEAIKGFLGRPLDQQSKEAALNALGNSRGEDVQLIELVIGALNDPDPGIRLTAVQVLRRIGRNAVLQAEPALHEVIEHPDESPQVRAAAREALQSIGHRPDPN
jgi:hypothetical protein